MKHFSVIFLHFKWQKTKKKKQKTVKLKGPNQSKTYVIQETFFFFSCLKPKLTDTTFAVCDPQ